MKKYGLLTVIVGIVVVVLLAKFVEDADDYSMPG